MDLLQKRELIKLFYLEKGQQDIYDRLERKHLPKKKKKEVKPFHIAHSSGLLRKVFEK